MDRIRNFFRLNTPSKTVGGSPITGNQLGGANVSVGSSQTIAHTAPLPQSQNASSSASVSTPKTDKAQSSREFEEMAMLELSKRTLNKTVENELHQKIIDEAYPYVTMASGVTSTSIKPLELENDTKYTLELGELGYLIKWKGDEECLKNLRVFTTHQGINSIYFYDPATGLVVRLHSKEGEPKEWVLVFGATSNAPTIGTFLSQIWANAKQFLGGTPASYRQAAELTRCLVAEKGIANVTVTGGSLGGGMAEYAALMNMDKDGNMPKAVTFNPSPLGRGLQKDIFREMRKKDAALKNSSNEELHIKAQEHATKKITSLHVRGDWLSHAQVPLPLVGPLAPKLDTGIERHAAVFRRMRDWAHSLGIRTRELYGKKYVMPPLEDNSTEHDRHLEWENFGSFAGVKARKKSYEDS